MRAGIALGSNLGDRHTLLREAVAQLKNLHEEGNFLASSFHETEPKDCPPSSPFFLNAVVELETSLPPLALLECLQRLELEAGRPKEHAFHAPRTLDLDILYYGALTLRLEELTLPHPRMTERLFVLAPLAEIRSDLRLPGWQMSCQEYLSQIDKK
jgi:2-amino-4-hydroxy-6-hydroxymethyldihydropteridine diphosphokinase